MMKMLKTLGIFHRLSKFPCSCSIIIQLFNALHIWLQSYSTLHLKITWCHYTNHWYAIRLCDSNMLSIKFSHNNWTGKYLFNKCIFYNGKQLKEQLNLCWLYRRGQSPCIWFRNIPVWHNSQLVYILAV